MSYKGAGSASALAFVFGRNGINRGKLMLAGLMLFLVAVLAVPTFAKAAPSITAADTYQTRGATPVTIEVLASDADAGTLSYSFVSADHNGTVGAFTTTGTGATTSFTPGDGYGGVEQVHIKVTNETTLQEATATVNINVVPVAHLLTGPGVNAPALTNDNTPTFTFDGVTGPGNGAAAGTTFNCRVDGVPQGTCNSGTFTTAVLGDGPHTFSVRATSPNGTNDTTFVPVSITVDTTNPGNPTLNGPSGITNSVDRTWTFTIPEGIAQCRLITAGDPDPAWDTCTSPKDYFSLADGDYTFEVRTKDDANNLSGVESKSITVDTVTNVTVDSGPVDGNLDAHGSIAFSSTEPTAYTFACRFYEADAVDVPAYTENCTSPFATPFLDKNVQYRFDVKVTDAAGNSEVASRIWLQANTAPAVVEPTATLEAGQAVTLDLGGSDADSDPITYSIVGAVDGGTLGAIDQDTGEVEFTTDLDAAGTYEIDYEVTDHRQGGTTAGTAVVHVQPGTDFLETPGSSVGDETKDQTPTWTFESPSGVTTFECNLDGLGWNACDGGSFTPATDLTEGDHTLEVRAVAEGTYADPTPPSSTITVDITAPDVTIDDTPVSLSNVAAPEFEFSTTDPTATFECKVDSGDFAACNSGDAIAAVTDGDHTFSVHSVDPSGNVGSDASYTWEADLTNPVIELTEGLEEGDWTNLRKPTWDFTEADLNLVPTSTTCTVDSQTLTNDCVGPWQPLTNLSDGNHTLHITSEDAAGNVGTLDVNFRVTTITPTAIVDSGPASPSGPSASFAFVSTTNLGDDGRFECRTRLNGGAWSSWATCDEDLTLTGLSSGTRNLEVRAVDSAGNYSTGAAVGSWTWTTIGTAPDTAITSQVVNGSSAAFGFNSPGNNLATFECSIDGGAFSTCTSPKSYTGLAVGAHTFSVRATNQVGTTDGSPATYGWTIAASVAPNTITDRKPPASTSATDAEFAFSSNDAAATFECRIDGGAWAACTSPKTYTGLTVGEHTFEARAVSNGKTDGTPTSTTWTIVAATVDPTQDPTCNDVAASTSRSKTVKVGKGLRVTVVLSHASAISGQTVTVKLLLNGKAPKGKLKKKLAKLIKGVDLVSAGNVVSSLSLGKSSAAFVIGDDTKSNFTVLIKKKKGKALRSSVSFKLAACE